ncbi:WD40 repeat domain-containing protein [Pleurocapsa sp. FMAR1]|nr:hypothetical protein [Pleurocapsa sp. FMAR1]
MDISTGKVIRNLRGHSDVITSIAISPDNRTIASSSDDGKIMV